MGFTLIGIKEGGNDVGALDDLDEITVEMEGGNRWTGSVGTFIGVSDDPQGHVFQSLGSPDERLRQITGSSHLLLSKKHPFVDVLRKAEDRWAHHVVPGDSKFTPRLRKGVLAEGYEFKDLSLTEDFTFNSPEEAAAQVITKIHLFCSAHPGWTPEDVLEFNKAMDPGNAEQVDALYHHGKFTDQAYSGAMNLYFPTEVATALVSGK